MGNGFVRLAKMSQRMGKIGVSLMDSWYAKIPAIDQC